MKDMHITNGIGRDFINADFLEFSSGIFSNSMSKEEQQKAIRKKLSSLEHVELPDYFYINQHGYTFADSSESAGINEPSMSNGAAYADLDNDGDLDLVINNINKDAFVFINNTNQKNEPVHAHFLNVKLKGDSLNANGFGAKLYLYDGAGVQKQEQSPVRGYFSSVSQQLFFGLGKEDHADSLVVYGRIIKNKC
ncbi:MAG: ASPIC/UnbV domain-containing protein [Chitinophagaceae bacterium]